MKELDHGPDYWAKAEIDSSRAVDLSLLEKLFCKRYASTLKMKQNQRGNRDNIVFFFTVCRLSDDEWDPFLSVWMNSSFSIWFIVQEASIALFIVCVWFKTIKSFNIQRWISLLQINEFLVIGYLKSKFVPLWTRPDFGKKKGKLFIYFKLL